MGNIRGSITDNHFPVKRHVVATLFLGKLIAESQEVPKDKEWKPINDIDYDVHSPFGLVWAKDTHGTIAKVIYFKKFPNFYDAYRPELVGGITHYIFIGE